MSEDRPFLVWIGRIEQEDFLKKTKTLRGHFGEFPCSNSSILLSSQLSGTPSGLWGLSSPNLKHWGESAHLRPQAPRRVLITEGPMHTPISPRRVHASTCRSSCRWRHGPETAQLCQSAGWEWRRAGLRPPELAAAQKTSKTGLPSLKPAGLFFFFF